MSQTSTLPEFHLPKLGSELFINREDSIADAQRWVQQMSESGFSLIRLFIFWDHVEPADGIWNFEVYDAVFDEAGRLNMGVVPTLMAETAPGWMKKTIGNQDRAHLEMPGHWQRGLQYVSACVSRWAKHPALNSWILWNEASYKPPQDDMTILLLRQFLKICYQNDISKLNAIYFAQFSDFEEIEWKHLVKIGDGPVPPTSEKMDVMRFTVWYLMERLKDIHRTLREIDSTTPIHENPHNVMGVLHDEGQDPWLEGELCDFLGCSAHPVHHASRYGFERWDEAIADFSAVMRGASKQRYFWVSELQGGASICSAGIPHCPTRYDIRRWLWTCLGSGAQAVVYWCFNTRHEGYEAGEWGLLDWRGQPSIRLQETQKVSQALLRHGDLFTACRPGHNRVRILCSSASRMHSHAMGHGYSKEDRRNILSHTDAVAGALLLFRRLGIPCDLISEQQLNSGEGLKNCELLVLPGVWSLEPQSFLNIAKYTRQGHHLLTDGLLGWKNPSGRVARQEWKALHGALGTEWIDVDTAQHDLELTTDGEKKLAGWWVRLSMQAHEDAQVLARDPEGRIVAYHWENSVTGSVTWWGTCAFQRFFSLREDTWFEALKSHIPDSIYETIVLEVLDDSAVVHKLNRSGGDPFYLIQNLKDETRELSLKTSENIQVCSTEGNIWSDLSAGRHLVKLEAGEVLIAKLAIE